MHISKTFQEIFCRISADFPEFLTILKLNIVIYSNQYLNILKILEIQLEGLEILLEDLVSARF